MICCCCHGLFLFPLTAAGAGFGVDFDKAWDARWLHGLQCFFHLAERGGGTFHSSAFQKKHHCWTTMVFGKLKQILLKKYKEIRNPTFLFFVGGGGWWGQKLSTAGCQWCFFGAYNFIHIEPWRFRFPVLFAPRVVRERPWKIWITRYKMGYEAPIINGRRGNG